MRPSMRRSVVWCIVIRSSGTKRAYKAVQENSNTQDDKKRGAQSAPRKRVRYEKRLQKGGDGSGDDQYGSHDACRCERERAIPQRNIAKKHRPRSQRPAGLRKRRRDERGCASRCEKICEQKERAKPHARGAHRTRGNLFQHDLRDDVFNGPQNRRRQGKPEAGAERPVASASWRSAEHEHAAQKYSKREELDGADALFQEGVGQKRDPYEKGLMDERSFDRRHERQRLEKKKERHRAADKSDERELSPCFSGMPLQFRQFVQHHKQGREKKRGNDIFCRGVSA